MDSKFAEGLDRTMRLAGNVHLKRVADEATREAQKRRKPVEEDLLSDITATPEEPGYGHGV